MRKKRHLLAMEEGEEAGRVGGWGGEVNVRGREKGKG